MTRDKIEEVLAHLQSLPENWDSYGAKKFDTRLIETIKKIATILPGYWQIVPTVEGGVCIEKHCNGEDILITIEWE